MRASPIQTYLPNYLSKIRVIPLANEIIYEKYALYCCKQIQCSLKQGITI